MSGKKWISISFAAVIVLVGAIILLYMNGTVSEEKITTDINKQIVRALKEHIGVEHEHIDARIEKFEDIDNTRFILYSFNNPLVGYRHTGYATYEIKPNSSFKRTGFGWDSFNFINRPLSTKEGKETKNYVIVYGMNKPSEKQVYEYTCGEEKRIEEFSGEYFLKKYPIGGNPVGFRNATQN